jgi:hypothetical protein
MDITQVSASTDVYDKLTEVWEKAKASIRPTTPSVAEDMQNDVISLTVSDNGCMHSRST